MKTFKCAWCLKERPQGRLPPHAEVKCDLCQCYSALQVTKKGDWRWKRVGKGTKHGAKKS